MMEAPIRRALGVVLAGGKSRRMGRNKALIELDGGPLISRPLAIMREVFDEVVIVANETETYAQFGARIIPDIYPGQGPLAGIHAALRDAKEQGYDGIFVVACDMPTVSLQAVRGLIALPCPDAIIPERGGRYEPLFAIYGISALKVIDEQLEAGQLSLQATIPLLSIRKVSEEELMRMDPELRSLRNINTGEDIHALNIEEVN